MGNMPMVKCPRCGEKFSALRADCPHCGYRRAIGENIAVDNKPRRERKVRPAKPSQPNDWQKKLGLILVAVAVVAIILMVGIGKSENRGGFGVPTPVPTAKPTAEPRPTPTPSPTPTVMNIKFFFLNQEILPEQGGFTMYVGDDPLTIEARAYPNDKLFDAPFTWRVSDPTKAKLTPSEDTQHCTVEVLESAGGYITLTATCYGVEYSTPLYIWSRD